MQLYGLLHLLDSAFEVARRLRPFLIGTRLGWMNQHGPRVIILIGGFHGLKLLVIVRLSVEIDVITRIESLPLP